MSQIFKAFLEIAPLLQKVVDLATYRFVFDFEIFNLNILVANCEFGGEKICSSLLKLSFKFIDELLRSLHILIVLLTFGALPLGRSDAVLPST